MKLYFLFIIIFFSFVVFFFKREQRYQISESYLCVTLCNTISYLASTYIISFVLVNICKVFIAKFFFFLCVIFVYTRLI